MRFQHWNVGPWGNFHRPLLCQMDLIREVSWMYRHRNTQVVRWLLTDCWKTTLAIGHRTRFGRNRCWGTLVWQEKIQTNKFRQEIASINMTTAKSNHQRWEQVESRGGHVFKTRNSSCRIHKNTPQRKAPWQQRASERERVHLLLLIVVTAPVFHFDTSWLNTDAPRNTAREQGATKKRKTNPPQTTTKVPF